MRYSRHHGSQRTTYDHVVKDREQRAAERDRERSERDNTVCTCGAITALNPCPYCGGERPEEETSHEQR